jgi:SAM-dependent methyltransferase
MRWGSAATTAASSSVVETEVAPDGSPVEVYRRLPPMGEAELVHKAAPVGATILELGCGTGRVTHELLRLGHPVTAVDEALEMLAHVHGAETVEASVEELDLPQKFDVVLLASHFVNEPEPGRRRRLLEVCARHVAADGSVLLESYPPHLDWEDAVGRTALHGEVAVTVREARMRGALVDAVVEYSVDGCSWRQPFTARMLDEGELGDALREAGLELVEWLDERRSWSRARPCENPGR